MYATSCCDVTPLTNIMIKLTKDIPFTETATEI